MNATVTLHVPIPPEHAARLYERTHAAGITPDEFVERAIAAALGETGASANLRRPPSPEPDRQKPTNANLLASPRPSHVPLDIGSILTGAEAIQLDALALRHGVPPEAMAAACVRRLLKRFTAPQRTFRLNMPEHAKRKLEEHAKELGCRAAELAAFLFTKRSSRPQATLAAR